MDPNRRGLTLIEFLVIVAIVVLAIGLFLPATRKVREPAARARCTNNLKQLMIGMHSYADVHGGQFPAGCFGPPASDPERRLSWQVPLLPHVEQLPLFQQIDPDKGFTPEVAAALRPLPGVTCPSSIRQGEPVTMYVALSGVGDAADGVIGYDRGCKLKEITDGLSNTIALAETNHALGPWARGGFGTVRAFDTEAGFGPDRPLGSAHRDGFNVAMCDGSVRFVRFDVDRKAFAAAVTVAGGEKLILD